MERSVQLDRQGYVVLDSILEPDELHCIALNSSLISHQGVGTRSLLTLDWVQALAQTLKQHPLLTPLLPNNAKAIQCNYFVKSEHSNWSVTLHRDLSVPVEDKIISEKWSAWSEKEGTLFAQPPRSVLDSLVILRLHLEENTDLNGPLELVPMSHENSNPKTDDQVREKIRVQRGGALVMKPLLLHASTKVITGQRRVLHFVFGPEQLPDQAQWKWAV